jgi:hypothetical protein
MSNGSFATVTSGLLARKGEAKPSAEQHLATVLQTPAFQPPQQRPPMEVGGYDADASADADAPLFDLSLAPPESVLQTKVRIDDANAMWPTKKPARSQPNMEEEMWKLDQRLGMPSSRHTERTSVRFTHAQARLLRLASVLLDRPQQELIEAGIEGKLQDLACTDLANCACFKAFMATLDKR